jgi:hypothetical protein
MFMDPEVKLKKVVWEKKPECVAVVLHYRYRFAALTSLLCGSCTIFESFGRPTYSALFIIPDIRDRASS